MRVGPVVGVCALFLLAGCLGGAFSGLDQANTSEGVAGARLTGSVHGGQQAIVGAQVYLFAANTTGYGGSGIAASPSNASLSLLTAGAGRTLDSSGGATNGDYYVTTDANGGFSITGDYTCTQNSQVYLFALGGNPGSGPNTAAGLMAVLGNCPAAGTFSSSLFVAVNEVSTGGGGLCDGGFCDGCDSCVEFGDCAGVDWDCECVCKCGEPGGTFDGCGPGDDSGGKWCGATDGD
jgi:hypothetical protein